MKNLKRSAAAPGSLLIGLLVVATSLPAVADPPVQQVQLRTRFVEVARHSLRNLGVDWGIPRPTVGVASPALDLGTMIRALERAGAASTLSTPRVTTASNQAAEIAVGGRVPLLPDVGNPPGASPPSSIPFEIHLQITPRVAPDDAVLLELVPEVSELEPGAAPGAAPIITRRRAATTVETVENGSTLVIGGLLGPDASAAAQRVPALGDVPVLGALFRSENFQRGRSQLLILVTATFGGAGGGLRMTVVPQPSPQQVDIETRFLEITNEAFDQLGVELVPAPGSEVGVIDTDVLSSQIGALERESRADVISNPRVLTESGEPARIEVGDRIEMRADAGVVEVTPPRFGIQLRVVPHVTKEGSILMEVTPRVSDVQPDAGPPGAPVFLQRRAATTVQPLRDDQTLVIAGLLQRDAAEVARKVPLLGDVPGLGWLFRSQGFQRGETELLIFVTPHIEGASGTSRPARSAGAAAPVIFSAGAGGGYFWQNLPEGSGGLGVVGVGDQEEFFLKFPDSVDGGAAAGTLMSWNLGPVLGGIPTHVYVRGGYAKGSDDVRKEVQGDPGVNNGISYWRPAQNGSEGISSQGAGLMGDMDYDFETAQFGAQMMADVTEPLENLLDSLFGGDGGRAAVAEPAVGSLVPGPQTFVELAGRMRYVRQKADQRVDLMNDDPVFQQFQVHTKNHIDLEEWSGMAALGIVHLLPLPFVEGLAASVGAAVGLGYRDSSLDGKQHDQCDVRFTSAPGVNQCAPEVQDFVQKADPHETGFDWDVGVTTRLYQQFRLGAANLFVSAGYEFAYVGISRVAAGRNLQQEGSIHLERTHQAQHTGSVTVGISF